MKLSVGSRTSFGKLHLWRFDELVPSASAIGEAFRRKPKEQVVPKEWRTRFFQNKFASFGFLRLPTASYGKLHLWRFLRKDRGWIVRLYNRRLYIRCMYNKAMRSHTK